MTHLAIRLLGLPLPGGGAGRLPQVLHAHPPQVLPLQLQAGQQVAGRLLALPLAHLPAQLRAGGRRRAGRTGSGASLSDLPAPLVPNPTNP